MLDESIKKREMTESELKRGISFLLHKETVCSRKNRRNKTKKNTSFNVFSFYIFFYRVICSCRQKAIHRYRNPSQNI